MSQKGLPSLFVFCVCNLSIDTEDVPSTYGTKLDDAELKVFPEQKNNGEGEADDDPVDYVPTDHDGNATGKTEG